MKAAQRSREGQTRPGPLLWPLCRCHGGCATCTTSHPTTHRPTAHLGGHDPADGGGLALHRHPRYSLLLLLLGLDVPLIAGCGWLLCCWCACCCLRAPCCLLCRAARRRCRCLHLALLLLLLLLLRLRLKGHLLLLYILCNTCETTQRAGSSHGGRLASGCMACAWRPQTTLPRRLGLLLQLLYMFHRFRHAAAARRLESLFCCRLELPLRLRFTPAE